MTDDDYDKTVSLIAYSTIYFKKKNDSNGLKHYCLTKVSGKYKIIDAGVKVSTQSVKYGEAGMSSFGGAVSLSNTYKPSSSSWSKFTNYSKYVAKVSGSTWKLKHKNYLLD